MHIEVTNEIVAEFEELSRMSWQDYCELCAQEHAAAQAEEAARGAQADAELAAHYA